MHFFTEPLKIQNQSPNQAFGAIDVNQYRLGNMFSAISGQTPKAFAITDGQVLVQKIGATNKYSIILKPTVQPDLNLPKIDYIIYKGIKGDNLISGNLVASIGQNDLTRIIHENATAWYAAKNPAETIPSTEPDANKSLGLIYNATAADPAHLKLDTASISDAFFATNGITLTNVFGGNHIGDFDTSGDFGIVIIYEKVGFQPTFKLARELDSILTFPALGGSPTNAAIFQRKYKKEDILAFLDSSAFFGAFVNSELIIYNGSAFESKKGLPLYTGVIEKHINKNKIYLDILNEYGDSFNYYENYSNTIRWSLNNTETLVDVNYYRNFEWPILVITDTEFNVTAGSAKVIRLSLPNRDNEFPLIYLRRAYREDVGLKALPANNEKFLTPIAAGQDANLVNQVRLNRNLIIPQINNLIFSNFFQIKYIKRAKVDDDELPNDETNNFYGKALFKRTYLDNIFPIFDMQVPFLSSTTTNLRIYNDVTHTDKILIKNPQVNIVGDYTLRDFTSSIGIAKDQNYTTLISFPFLYNDNINHNNDLLPLSTMEFGKNPFLIELNNLISSVNLVRSSFTHNGQNIEFLKFENNATIEGSAFTPTHYTFNDVLIISITNQQYNNLVTLKNANFPGGYKVYLGIKDITPILSNGNNYYSFHLVLRGLRVVGNNVERHFLDTNIISYTNEDILGISSGHVFPVANAYIEEDYGERNGGHLGIDIEAITDAATPGSPIYAARSGTVEKIVKSANLLHNGGYDSDKAGVRIRVQGDNGYFYYYFHLAPGSNDAFSVGDVITAGQQIGNIGLSGQGYGVNPNWTQYHLHFEIWSSVSPIRKVNPYTVFPELALLPFDTHRRR
jgi:murein DD-endopeptidase MepM/ murein hydrolase activator NlpD